MRFIYLLLICIFTLSLGNSLTAQHRNCGATEYLQQQIAVDPDRVAKMEALEQHTQRFVSQGGASQRAVTTIPVVVHVVYRTSTENISDAQIQTQLDVINEDFRRLNSDADNTWPQATDSEIEFCLATIDPNGNPTTGITRTSTTVNGFGTNDQVKYSSQGGKDAWPTADYLNFWVCNIGGGILGYAQFPGGPAATDGVVNGYQYTGTIGTAQAPFNLGRTATHEIGHWLNLRHIWGDGGCNVDDFVSDTPTSDASNGGCSTGHVSCGTVDMVQNYMDYSDDACMNLFTQGQKDRMQAVLAPGGFRASLANSNGCNGDNNGPTCMDGIQNGNETGIDCGGPCDACPTCDDGIQNGDETGVDCGGSSCATCPSNCTDNEVVVTVVLDQYGSETTWTVTDANGAAVGTGGPYQDQSTGTEEVVTLCLPDGCYNFTINDVYGDGICCAYGQGSFEVADVTGVLVAGAEFASSETTAFCVGGVIGATCDDGILNGNETGVDCGGDCAPCATCNDGVQNGDETGVDCGGSDCAPCATCDDGVQNGGETGVDCGGDCAPCATCDDGVQNGDEEGVDCGGADCVPCATCQDGVQNGNETGVDCGGDCAACVSCDDGVQNGDETGVDCGGNDCAPCPTCIDGIQNGNETGVDCGGDCAPCNTGTCTDVTLTLVLDRYGSETAWDFTNANGDVLASGSGYPNNQDGLTITETLCLDDGCYDFNISDAYGDGICCAYGQGSYTITDSNGDVLGQGGQFNTNDTAPFCIGNDTATCNDGVQNGDEEGVDCGGSNCAPCQVTPTCNDGIQNGNETGIDCGGLCAPCATCDDGVQNGQETGVDCGGPDCQPCSTGTCMDVTLTLVLDQYGSETAWNFTNDNGDVLASGSGYPNNQNGLTITETLCLEDGCYDFNITDAYGDGICCAYGQGSYTITDSDGNILGQGGQFTASDTAPFCINGSTPTPTCTDGIQNGQETDVDCGGPDCAPCQAAPTCTDGIQNGQETGVDCGGPDCAPCSTGCTDITLTLQLDNYGSETAWEITDASGGIIGSGSGYSDTPGGETFVASGCLDVGCYTFTITDSYGDGICCAYGDGYYEIVDSNGVVLITGGTFAQSESATFCLPNPFMGGRVATEAAPITQDLEISSIYPNPVKEVLNIDYQATEGGTVQVTVFDVLGRVVIQKEQDFLGGKNHLQLDVNGLQAGYHLVKIQKGETQFTQKFIKN